MMKKKIQITEIKWGYYYQFYRNKKDNERVLRPTECQQTGLAGWNRQTPRNTQSSKTDSRKENLNRLLTTKDLNW